VQLLAAARVTPAGSQVAAVAVAGLTQVLLTAGTSRVSKHPLRQMLLLLLL
jgi:VIT1/CCC1 family predicted Fe2+/Mn2+ transporter